MKPVLYLKAKIRRMKNAAAGLLTRLRKRRRAIAIGFVGCCALLALWIAWPMDVGRSLRADVSPELLDRNGRTLYVFLNAHEQWRMERGLDRISPWLVKAAIAAEDQRFRSHRGVDPLAMGRALIQDAVHLRIISGASTLEMQTVKLAGIDSSRPLGKLRQILGALRLAAHADKDTVLAAYLNAAPYGLNLVGCEAAARRYFGKPAAELTLPEAALLAGLPKSPARLAPLAHPAAALRRREYVLRRMRETGAIGQAELEAALAAPLGTAWHEFPTEAPHLAMRLRAEIPGGHPLATTLDADVQSLAIESLRKRLAELYGEATGGAVVVLDATNADVLAQVGSPDFSDSAHAGQFDSSGARRSPGSTLKPFLYALAIANNRLYPSEALLDDTLDLGLYQPRNFDETHHGLVAAGDALRASLNIPAVMVLGRIGDPDALAFLRRCGLTTLDRSPDEYGPGLAVGNCEARLDQLAAAYAMLANAGLYRPSQQIPRKPIEPERILTRGAALSVMNALRQSLPGEADPQAAGTLGALTPVAWKTGTSTGNHDAWSFVFNQQYVVGVWIGNPDGRPSPRLVGAEAALPLAAEIFRRLPPSESPPWPAAGEDLRPVEICALSGLPATRWCPHVRVEMLPREAWLNRRCDVHWPAPARGGGDAGDAEAIVERWPGSALDWDLASVRAPVSIRRESSATMASARALQILVPANAAQYVLTGEQGGDRIRLQSSLDKAEAVHWFLNDRYLGASSAERPIFLDLTSGTQKLVCVGPGEATASETFTVVAPDARIRFGEDGGAEALSH